jgi:ribA/ribD-fused uncharacterized protein
MITSFNGEYSFLSNFYPCQIEYYGVKYPTSEHAFQAAKTLNIMQKEAIKKADTPGKAKRLGRKVEIRSDWEEVKDQVMYEIILNKFKNKEMKAKLLATNNEKLVEGNYWHDNYWGSCACLKCQQKPKENKLGKILMRVREELKEDSE